MANNRLYIEDTEAGEQFLLAKSHGAGWIFWPHGPESFDEWMEGRDIPAGYGVGNDHGPTKLRLVVEHGGKPEPEGVEFSAFAVRIAASGKLCHFADGRLMIDDEHKARELAEFKREDGIECAVVPVRVRVQEEAT